MMRERINMYCVYLGVFQLAESIGQDFLNRNQSLWIMPYPQKESIVQSFCIVLFIGDYAWLFAVCICMCV